MVVGRVKAYRAYDQKHILWPSWKLIERQVGPYPISKIISPNAVELNLLPSFKIDAPINVSVLQLYKPPTILGQQITPQPPIDIKGGPEYIVG